MEETSTQTSLALQSEITSRPRTKCDSTVDSVISYLRNLSQFWFTHILLILLLVAYTFGGAYLFHYLEVDHHKQMVVSASEIRNKVMNQLWNECRMNNSSKSRWILTFKTKMSGYHNHLCVENIWMDEIINNDTAWSFLRAVFYCGTVFTATGYGNIVTTTRSGQMITLIYAIIGIPYTLTVLLDIGSILTNGMRRAYIEIYKLYYFGCCCWKGSIPSNLKFDNSNITRQYATASTSTYSSDFDEPHDKLFLVAGLKKSDFVIPIWVGCALILAYTFLGAWIFFYYESWTYWEALYFIVVSLTTVGFGDYVPKHSSYPLTFCYILIGLAFVSLFFNLVVDRISKAMHKARRKIKRRMRKETKTREFTEEDRENGKMGHRSAITVRLVDTLKKMKRISSSPEISNAPVVFLKISDTNLLRYVKFDKVKGNKQQGQEAYISDKHFLKYLKEKMDVKQKVSF